MNRVIFFFTNNEQKAESMKRAMNKFRISLLIEKNFGIPEIQADTCKEVAEFGAKWATEKIGKPVIKTDAGIFVDALNGLPGVYTSQFHKKLGVEKFMKLMDGEENRNAKIIYALSYCEPGKQPITFSHTAEGETTEKLDITDSLIGSVFIPKGEDKVLGIIRRDNPEQAQELLGNTEEKFAKWFIEHRKEIKEFPYEERGI